MLPNTMLIFIFFLFLDDNLMEPSVVMRFKDIIKHIVALKVQRRRLFAAAIMLFFKTNRKYKKKNIGYQNFWKNEKKRVLIIQQFLYCWKITICLLIIAG